MYSTPSTALDSTAVPHITTTGAAAHTTTRNGTTYSWIREHIGKIILIHMLATIAILVAGMVTIALIPTLICHAIVLPIMSISVISLLIFSIISHNESKKEEDFYKRRQEKLNNLHKDWSKKCSHCNLAYNELLFAYSQLEDLLSHNNDCMENHISKLEINVNEKKAITEDIDSSANAAIHMNEETNSCRWLEKRKNEREKTYEDANLAKEKAWNAYEDCRKTKYKA